MDAESGQGRDAATSGGNVEDPGDRTEGSIFATARALKDLTVGRLDGMPGLSFPFLEQLRLHDEGVAARMSELSETVASLSAAERELEYPVVSEVRGVELAVRDVASIVRSQATLTRLQLEQDRELFRESVALRAALEAGQAQAAASTRTLNCLTWVLVVLTGVAVVAAVAAVVAPS